MSASVSIEGVPSISARCACSTTSRFRFSQANAWWSSDRAARARARCCAASMVWKRSMPAKLSSTARWSARAGRRSATFAPKSAWCSSSSTCFRTRPSWTTSRWRRCACAMLPRAEAVEQARELLARVGLPEKADEYPCPPVGRAAAARRDRPRTGHATEGDAVRRADVGARSGAGR